MQKLSHLIGCTLIAVSAAIACGQTRGSEAYMTNCLPCHGETGDANTPAGKKLKAASFMTPEVLKKTDAEMFVTIRKGKDDMPAWGEVLTDDEIKNVIAYIRTLQKKP